MMRASVFKSVFEPCRPPLRERAVGYILPSGEEPRRRGDGLSQLVAPECCRDLVPVDAASARADRRAVRTG
jgi:hypothetical protein